MSYTSPTVTPDGTVLGAVGKQLVAVRATGGHALVRWRFAVPEIIEVTPAVAPDGTIILGTNGVIRPALLAGRLGVLGRHLIRPLEAQAVTRSEPPRRRA